VTAGGDRPDGELAGLAPLDRPLSSIADRLIRSVTSVRATVEYFVDHTVWSVLLVVCMLQFIVIVDRQMDRLAVDRLALDRLALSIHQYVAPRWFICRLELRLMV